MNRDAILAATNNGYEVFRHYLSPHYPNGRIEAGKNISNPFLPKQKTPSFNIYQDSSGVWHFKDFAHVDCSGDCFDFAARINGLDTRNDFPAVLEQIRQQCGLTEGEPFRKPDTNLTSFSIERKEFSPSELDYWKGFGISLDTLNNYGVRSLASYTATARNGKPYTVKASTRSPMFAYPYGPNGFKVYRPHSKQDKFRFIGTKPEESVWGFDQLPQQCEVIVITAGEKDALAAIAHGFPAVTLNSETARLSSAANEALQARCKHLVCCYDTDKTGKAAAACLWAEYGITVVPLPSWIADGDGKDLSDFFQFGGTSEEFSGMIAEAIERASSIGVITVNTETTVNAVNGVNGNDDLLSTVDAESLLAMEFTEPEWIVERFLPPGLAILGGRPKHGKSWLALNLALAIANGLLAFGMFQAAACETLYLALEDNHRRLQKRLKMILSAEQGKAPPRLHFRTKFRRFDNGGFDDLRAYLTARPETRLVIIDTLAKLRGRQRGGKDTYAGDYEELGELQAIALEFKVAIIVVHHTTKMDYADPFDSISGTSGVSGAADTLFVLKREPGGVTLYTRGRDIDEAEIAMKFDQTNGVWSAIGDAAEVRLSEERRKILDAVIEGGPMSPKEIADETELPYSSVRHLCRRMAKAGTLNQEGNGKYGKPV